MTAGLRVRIQSPRGSVFDGLLGTVTEVHASGTVMVRLDLFYLPLPFGASELKEASR